MTKMEISKKENFKSRDKKSIMATSEGLENETDEEETNLALMTSTFSNAESKANYEDAVFSKLIREDLVNVVKDLINHYHGK